MGLPTPVPDNPLKWDGWKNFNSPNPYERLCLDFDSHPHSGQIEDNCRQLLMWWQKKLPLKNQPSNPMAQILRLGLDEAPARLAEARTLLLDESKRAQIDAGLVAKAKENALAEFQKFLSFALTSGALTAEEEESLYVTGKNLGLQQSEMEEIIEAGLQKSGARRLPKFVPQPPPVAPAPAAAAPVAAGGFSPQNPREEFLRMLRLSGIDEITDDQRDAFCNMGEAIGLSGGDAEDIIDEYLEERMIASASVHQVSAKAPPKPVAPVRPAAPKVSIFSNSPLIRSQERENYPGFTNSLGMSMMLVTSGSFLMGSAEPDATPNEQPVTKTNLSAFHLSRLPVTNAQYEQFDPSHRAKRAPWADDQHPVIYVSAQEAARFCDWLGTRERRRYRLPSEAEWEYAARGTDGRIFPWGQTLQSGDLANFADANTRFPWADQSVDDGFAETSPVGSYPKGVSPFGIEDMAGNVWEWCLDGMIPYPGKERTNPRGPTDGPKRIYRGGSWKSRIGSLRTTARSFNTPNYSANDVGFRVLCEIVPKG